MKACSLKVRVDLGKLTYRPPSIVERHLILFSSVLSNVVFLLLVIDLWLGLFAKITVVLTAQRQLVFCVFSNANSVLILFHLVFVVFGPAGRADLVVQLYYLYLMVFAVFSGESTVQLRVIEALNNSRRTDVCWSKIRSFLIHLQSKFIVWVQRRTSHQRRRVAGSKCVHEAMPDTVALHLLNGEDYVLVHLLVH